MAEVTKEIFIEEYQNFTGSDREFAEYLNEKYKPKTPFNAKSVFSRRKRLKLKTINPRNLGDTDGLREFVKNYKGTEIYKGFVKETGDRFGVDRKTAGQIIKQLRPDIKELPRKETVEQRLKRERDERKVELVEKEKNRITQKEFKEEYKKFKPIQTGSDAEFAEYLNKNTRYTSYRGEPFTARNVSQFRRDFGVEAKLFTTRPKVFDDKFILKEAERMNLDIDVKNTPIDKIRTAVFGARALEKNMTDAQKRELYIARNKRKNTRNQPRFYTRIPVEKNPKGLFWQDLVENALRHQTFLKRRRGTPLPESHIKFLNPEQKRPTSLEGSKNIKLIDTNVIGKQNKPVVLTYDNFLKHLDKNSKLYDIDSKTALKEYEKKRFIQKNPDLRNEFNLKLNSRYDPTSATKRSVFSPFHIHHTAGRGQNAFNVQFAVGTENMAENAFRIKFNKNFKEAKTLTEKKEAVKKYLDAVPENLEVRLKKTPYGTRETLTEVTTRIAPELSEAVSNAIKLYEDASPNLKVQLEDRIGCKRGCFIQTVTQEPQKVMNLVKPVSATTTNNFRETGLKWNNDIGAFVTPNEDVASQADLKKYAADNPMEVKVGEEPVKAATNKSVLANVGKAMARVGAPLPVAAIDAYFIGQQVKEGKGTAEIASNPLNWLGLATMEPLAKASGIAEGGGLNKALRLGLNPATIRGITRFAGLPGLAISTAMTAYDQYQKYKDGEGFIFNLLNQKGTE